MSVSGLILLRSMLERSAATKRKSSSCAQKLRFKTIGSAAKATQKQRAPRTSMLSLTSGQPSLSGK